MAITQKVWNFPTFPISKQLFHVPGAALDGGFTSGGARIMSPEPGGFAMLEIQPSLSVTEWDFPLSSWLMSKTNGQILRIQLAPTPQVAGVRLNGPVPWDGEILWSNAQKWSGDMIASYAANSFEGTNVVTVDMTTLGPVLRPGHVIGHLFSTYLIDDVQYLNGIATVTVTPPLRNAVAAGDTVFFRSYFTGSIANSADFRTTYDAENDGHIQIGKIILNEVVL